MDEDMYKRNFGLEGGRDRSDEILNAVNALDGVSAIHIGQDLKGTVEFDEKKIDAKKISETISSLGIKIKEEDLDIKVEGMGCGGCAETIEKGLKSMDGVSMAKVSFEDKSAKVRFNPISTSIDEMRGVVAGLGYKLL